MMVKDENQHWSYIYDVETYGVLQTRNTKESQSMNN